VNGPLPDWVGWLVVAVVVGGSVAFGLAMYTDNRVQRERTEECLRQVAYVLRGEYVPRSWTRGLHRSTRAFGAAAGTRAGFSYELSRYPLNAEDAAGWPYLAIRPRAGMPRTEGEPHEADPEVAAVLGNRMARRLPREAAPPLLGIVAQGRRAYWFNGLLVVESPDDELHPDRLASWAERVLAATVRLFPY
jgi:hypothetical protein